MAKKDKTVRPGAMKMAQAGNMKVSKPPTISKSLKKDETARPGAMKMAQAGNMKVSKPPTMS